MPLNLDPPLPCQVERYGRPSHPTSDGLAEQLFVDRSPESERKLARPPDAAQRYVTLGTEIGKERTLEPGQAQVRGSRDVGNSVREAERKADRANKAAHRTGPETFPEPKQKSVEMDLGM